MPRTLLPLALLATLSTVAFGQDSVEETALYLRRVKTPIVIDGMLDEPGWFSGQPARDFWEYFPSDTAQAPVQTEIYMAYDDAFLYVGAICHSVGQDYIIPSLRRDFRAGGNDNITFIFDTFNDRTNAFVFGMNPYGVTREALIANGGQVSGQDFDESWDNKWRGASSMQEGYWSCELAIPFSAIRFQQGTREWNFNSYRFDMQSNTRSTWTRIPQNQSITNLAFMGKMYWEEPLSSSSGNLSVIPYLTGGFSQDFEEGDGQADYQFNAGGDAKVAVTSGLNLDLTINPDFSQVEVDQQVINLDRFEVRFPERRQFFLENADLFGNFGFADINPFFSRRIGVAQDTATGLNVQNPIYGGARLSGKLDNNWRIGLLSMQASPDRENGLPAFNYSIAAVQRKLFSRSNLGAIFVNKQAFGKQDSSELYASFNRIAGLDYNLASSDNRWNGKAFYHRAFTPEQLDWQFAHGARLEYRVRKFGLMWQHQQVGANYHADAGFIRRQGYFSINPQATLFFYPAGGPMNQHQLSVESEVLWTPGYGRTDHRYELSWEGNFRNTAELRARLRNEYTFLLEGFDPTRTDSDTLPGLQGYHYSSVEFEYESDRRPKFSFSVNPQVGEFFNGYRYGMEGSLTYRYQPYGAIQLNVNYNYLDLPINRTSIFLIGPRIDLTFSRSIFLTVFLQYNDQLENININTRLQWRFAPVSDFFLVYTDNYYAEPFGVRNRSLVAKATYWLNL